jgi:hypothetical protein
MLFIIPTLATWVFFSTIYAKLIRKTHLEEPFSVLPIKGMYQVHNVPDI